MDFQVEIEYWEDVDGTSPIIQFIRERPMEHQVRIKKRNDHFRSLTFQQFRNTPFFEPAKGAKYPLWELKYLASRACLKTIDVTRSRGVRRECGEEKEE